MNLQLQLTLFAALFATVPIALAKPVPSVRPIIVVNDLRANESPVAVEHTTTEIAHNAAFKRMRAHFTFTNPNPRIMSGEFEFPLPDEAIVCGYALEINGVMVPGVVCEQEKARVAFENETRKGVDPGLVEHVKGNVWRTRIFPLNPQTPRKATVDYIVPQSLQAPLATPILERDGDRFFLASDTAAAQTPDLRATIAAFSAGTILWDASLSARHHAKRWRERLDALPENGDWQVNIFRNRPGNTLTFKTKADLLKAVDHVIYDGGTDIAAALQTLKANEKVLLFTDEMDTLGLEAPTYETREGLTVASRDAVPLRAVTIREVTQAQAEAMALPIPEGTLLATVWAARRMQDLAAQADVRKAEFLALGRAYGVAGPGLSLIVLETLEQWLKYQIEPPKALTFHAEWVKRRAAMDDPIAEKRAKAEREQQLLKYWEERVTWWNNPIPPKKTPKSGLFDLDEEAEEGEAVDALAAPVALSGVYRGADNAVAPQSAAPRAAKQKAGQRLVSGAPAPVPTVTLKPWDPQTPYLKALDSAPTGENYQVYLKQRETYAEAPAFYLDCAGWFFTHHGDAELAERIITNLAEFKLEDPALWRTMGWRLREAGRYHLAIHCFRKVLHLRNEEGQSRRDLALVLAEAAKATARAGNLAAARPQLEEAMHLLTEVVFTDSARRSSRRGNDLQVAIIALEELNGLISWCNAQAWPNNEPPKIPVFDAAYRRDLPVKLRIVMSWDADNTDIDIHVLEPNGEEAYYGNRRTASGGFVSEDVTTGYGPEEYLKKDLEAGVYKVLTHYFASRQTELTGATTVTVTVYTDWGTASEQQQTLTLRLDQPKKKHLIGEITL